MSTAVAPQRLERGPAPREQAGRLDGFALALALALVCGEQPKPTLTAPGGGSQVEASRAVAPRGGPQRGPAWTGRRAEEVRGSGRCKPLEHLVRRAAEEESAPLGKDDSRRNKPPPPSTKPPATSTEMRAPRVPGKAKIGFKPKSRGKNTSEVEISLGAQGRSEKLARRHACTHVCVFSDVTVLCGTGGGVRPRPSRRPRRRRRSNGTTWISTTCSRCEKL